MQRIAQSFTYTLRERIDKVCATGTHVNGREKSRVDQGLDPTSTMHVKLYQKIPMVQITYFAGIQAIVEEVVSARNIDIIDLEIGSRVQWTIFMQVIADERKDDHCPTLESLTITAVQFSQDKSCMNATRNILLAFAGSMNLPLFFKVLHFPELKGSCCISRWSSLALLRAKIFHLTRPSSFLHDDLRNNVGDTKLFGDTNEDD